MPLIVVSRGLRRRRSGPRRRGETAVPAVGWSLPVKTLLITGRPMLTKIARRAGQSPYPRQLWIAYSVQILRNPNAARSHHCVTVAISRVLTGGSKAKNGISRTGGRSSKARLQWHLKCNNQREAPTPKERLWLVRVLL
jgi:hypothetical protein